MTLNMQILFLFRLQSRWYIRLKFFIIDNAELQEFGRRLLLISCLYNDGLHVGRRSPGGI